MIEYSDTFGPGYGMATLLGSTINSNSKILHANNNEEINLFVGSSLEGLDYIGSRFDGLERLLIWEMSKPVPEVDAIKLDKYGLSFRANGMRSEADVQREGQEAVCGP